MLRAHAEREASAETDALAIAWYTAKLMRARRLPSLESILRPASEAPPIEQSRADHEALLAAAANN